jgi:hypothetical protein
VPAWLSLPGEQTRVRVILQGARFKRKIVSQMQVFRLRMVPGGLHELVICVSNLIQ